MRILTLTFLALLLCVSNTFAAQNRPNIIVILADDVGYSDLGCYGSEIHTPNLDKLASNGLRFTQFYNTARCCPTRAALLTGLYPHQAGVGHMTQKRKEEAYSGTLNNNCVTIAEVLRPAGYRTYMTGKWHVTASADPKGDRATWPCGRGFDHFYGTILGGGNYFDPAMLTRDHTPVTPHTDPEYKTQNYYYTDALADNSIKFIEDHQREHAGKPFFLYLAFTAAHWPLQAPAEAIEKYRGKYDTGYESIRKQRVQKMKKLGLLDSRWEDSPNAGEWDKVEDKVWEARCMEVYAAQIDRMDQGIGKLVKSLKKNDMYDNTLIFYMQDNGACAEPIGRGAKPAKTFEENQPPKSRDEISLGVHYKQTREGLPVRSGTGVMPGADDTFISYGKNWANVSNTPLREYKHWVHEGGISTPLIAHWPNEIKSGGKLRAHPAHLIDIMATCVAVSGAAYPSELNGQKITLLEGRSLVPAFKDEQIERDAIFWEHEGNRALRQGNWKLVAKGPAGNWELYDIETDRTEMHDLAGAQPAKLKELAAKWETWAKRANVLPWIWNPPYGQPESAAKKGSDKGRFELKNGEELRGEESPATGGKPIHVTASVAELADGVIVAQGAATEGFSLYIKEGKAHFAIRRGGTLTTISAREPVSAKTVKLEAKIVRGGAMTLLADGREVATDKAPGLLTRTPTDPLSVGSDSGKPVGEYDSPFKFKGKIDAVVIEVGK